MPAKQIGVREFRENLAAILESSDPVAITRHGETVGFFIPARKKRAEVEREAFRAAAEKLQAMMAAAGGTEEELVAEFEEARRRARRKAS